MKTLYIEPHSKKGKVINQVDPAPPPPKPTEHTSMSKKDYDEITDRLNTMELMNSELKAEVVAQENKVKSLETGK